VIHSVTKSFTSALVGIALDKGYIKSVKQPLLEFFPEETIANLDEQKKAITLEHLLIMSSGLDTKDSWLYQWAGLAKMKASDDWAQYVLDRPMAQIPGGHFDYSNGGSFLLSAILQKSTKVRPLAFAKKHLFGPLGITNVIWPTSRQGINMGYDGLMLAPLDIAKLGLLYLNKGQWENKQIVSQAWVETSTRKHISANLYDGYGYQWWVPAANYYSPEYYFAAGYLGQFIFVVPQMNLVVVFTSNLKGDDFFIPEALLDDYIIPAAVSFHPLPAQSKKKEHLDSLIANFVKAPVQGIIWTSEENGVAKNGEFVRTTSPAFRFEYPKTSYRKHPLDFPGAAMVMDNGEDFRFSAGIWEIQADTKLADLGLENITELEKIGSDIQVISNNKITLEDGTEAYRTEASWKFQSSWPTRSLFVSAIKEGKAIIVEYHFPFTPWDEASTSENLKEGTFIVESLTFK